MGMEQEAGKQDNKAKMFWQLVIALITILLLVLSGGIIIILIQGGHYISGREVISDISFPLVVFVSIWTALIRRQNRPTPKQEKLIKTMLLAVLILFVANILIFVIF